MLFMTTWKTRPQFRDQAIERFKQTGGQPPAGVRLLGRWHSVAQDRGVTISEADDPKLVAKWCMDWSDLLELEVTPVVTDEEAAAVFSS